MNATSMARGFVGVILIVAGISLAVYVGVWWAFIGGIVQAIDGVKATPTDAWEIAYGIVRIVFAGFLGTITAVVAVFPGWAMLQGR